MSFPIKENSSIIPSDFRCYNIDFPAGFSYGLKRLACKTVIAVDSPAGWEVARGRNSEPDHIDMFFIQTGRLRLDTPDGSQMAGAGQKIIVPSWLDRHLKLEEASAHIYVRFEKDREECPELHSIIVRNSTTIEALNFYVQTLLVSNMAFEDEPDYRQHLTECLAILLKRELTSINAPSSHSTDKDKLIRQLQNATASTLNVASMARKFCLSPSSFRLFCLEHFGKTPCQLINEVRMSRARALLRYSDLSIETIAQQLGFADRFTFSKAFTKLTGQPPVAFRKQLD